MPAKSNYSVAIGAETYRNYSWELSEEEARTAIRCDVKDQKEVQAANPGRIVIGVSSSFIDVKTKD